MKTLQRMMLAGASVALVATAAFAQTTPPAAQPQPPQADQANPGQPKLHGRLARLDTNNDGVIDQQEFATVQNLKDADANGDGTLSNDELAAMIMKRQAERQAERLARRLDIDGDGKVTVAEIEKNRSERFALMDRNDDGKLEGNELRRQGGDRAGRDRRGDRQFGHHGDRRGGDREFRRWRDRDGDRGGEHHRRHQNDDGPMDL